MPLLSLSNYDRFNCIEGAARISLMKGYAGERKDL